MLLSKRYGQLEHFERVLLQPLQAELLRTTWMHERLDCEGRQRVTREPFYFEYPLYTVD